MKREEFISKLNGFTLKQLREQYVYTDECYQEAETSHERHSCKDDLAIIRAVAEYRFSLNWDIDL